MTVTVALPTRSPVYASAHGYSASASAADNATALLAALEAAEALGSAVVVPGVEATVGSLGTIPVSTCVRFHFENGATLVAPGSGLTSASDITLAAIAVSFQSTGRATFRGYRRVFDFDAIAAGATVEAEGMTFEYCGRVYDYTQSGSRQDFNGAFGCKSTSASAIESLSIRDFTCTDYGGRVCEFGIVWRGPFNRASIDGFYSNGLGRIGIMLGDNYTWDTCLNITLNNVVCRNIYPRVGTASEYEIHAYLLYGKRQNVANVIVDTCYDLHDSIHDSEACYHKGLFINLNSIQVRNGSRGDSYIAVKGLLPTTSELLDVDALGGDTPYAAFVTANNIVLHADPDFVTSYGVKTGLYVLGNRVNVGAVHAVGAFDRCIDMAGGSCNVSGPVTLVGDSNYGVLVTTAENDPGAVRVSNVSFDGLIGSSGIEYRLANSSAVTVPVVEFSDCIVIHRGAVACGSLFRVDVQKSGNQQTLKHFKGSNLNAICTAATGTGASTGFLFTTDGGSGANEGLITRAELTDCDTDGCELSYRFAGTAGKISYVSIDGGMSGPSNGMLSNPTMPTTLRLRGVTGTYETEKTGTGTVAAGATTATITPGFHASRQANQFPDAVNHITITPGDLGSASKWWITSIGSGTFQMNTDVAPGGSGFTFGYTARNKYFG